MYTLNAYKVDFFGKILVKNRRQFKVCCRCLKKRSQDIIPSEARINKK